MHVCTSPKGVHAFCLRQNARYEASLKDVVLGEEVLAEISTMAADMNRLLNEAEVNIIPFFDTGFTDCFYSGATC